MRSLATPSRPTSASDAAITSSVPDPRVLRVINPLICAILRSPLHHLLSGQMLVLTYTGRRSGQRHTLPVGYLPDEGGLLVISQHAEQKRWWRNLRNGAPVVVYLRGRRVTARADVTEDVASVAAKVEQLVARLGASEASARLYLRLDTTPPPTREQLVRGLRGIVLIRVTPGTEAGGQG